MNTVEVLEAALGLLRQLGYSVRYAALDGQAGGACVIRGRRWLFLDLQQSPQEHLQVALAALRDEPAAHGLEIPPGLKLLMGTAAISTVPSAPAPRGMTPSFNPQKSSDTFPFAERKAS